jgi:hypothetical protein
MKYEVAICFNSFNINLFYNLVRPLTRRQTDNLASELGKIAHALSRQSAHSTTLLPRNIIFFMFPALISVRGWVNSRA